MGKFGKVKYLGGGSKPFGGCVRRKKGSNYPQEKRELTKKGPNKIVVRKTWEKRGNYKKPVKDKEVRYRV